MSDEARQTSETVRVEAPDLTEITSAEGQPTAGGTVPTESGELLPRQSALSGFRRISGALLVSDAGCVLAALLVAHLIRHGRFIASPSFLGVMALALPLWAAVFHSFGLYRIKQLSAWDEFRGIISATTVGVVLIIFCTFWWRESLSRVWLGWTWAFALLFELIVRRLWRWHVRRSKRLGRLAFRTLIVGTNEEAEHLLRTLSAPVRGFAPVGYIATSDNSPSSAEWSVVGRVGNLEQAISEHAIECVFVASTAVTARDMVRVSRACRQANVEMRVSANLPDILTSRLTIQPIEDVMAVSVKPVTLTGMQALAKRSFDVMMASLFLVLTLPVMAAIALAIRLTSEGPVLFRQQRVTKDGRLFTMYKFRTMRLDTDRTLRESVIDLTKPFFKLKDDPRLTRVGRFIRPLSLDELPQLYNVITGDMSLVGPRPLPAEQVAANSQLLAPRHEVRAGITGWWQIGGRSELDSEEAVRMDLFYIDNWSLSLDLYIVLKTLGTVAARRGAY
jgi:exopolysaccharide biosynthesis polyprenyl glycosylphosphotransferase